MFLNLILVFLLLFCIYLFFFLFLLLIYIFMILVIWLYFPSHGTSLRVAASKKKKVFLFITSDLFSPLRVAGSFINAFYGGTNAWIMPAAALQKKKKKNGE